MEVNVNAQKQFQEQQSQPLMKQQQQQSQKTLLKMQQYQQQTNALLHIMESIVNK